MSDRDEQQRLVSRVQAALSVLLAVPEDEVRVRTPASDTTHLVVSTAGKTFAVQVVAASAAGILTFHAERAAQAAKSLGKRSIPLLAVPFMGDAGRQACERAGVSWFDFSGNAHIIGPGLRVIVDGRPNQFRTRGRPASAFAPKSSRVARYLLMQPGEAVIQREIARATGVSEGFVSRIVARLVEERYVIREEGGTLRVKDPRLMLDAWRDEYRFSKHTIIRGHVAARSGDALAHLVGDRLKARSVEHAVTGLAAAWQLTRYATFRIATFYVEAEPDSALRDELGFREDERGANLWLVVPNDKGVFQGAGERDGLRCVHPIQTYLDLKEQPERASEAAERLRADLLNWQGEA